MERTTTKIDLLQVAEVELIYRSKVRAADRPQVNDSEKAYQVFMHHWNRDTLELREQLKVLFLSRDKRAIGIYELSSGGTTSTDADPRLLFAAALNAAATSIIIAHNHPSGRLQPSKGDEAMTQKIQAGGKLLEIPLNDHLIITNEGYFSFADEGLL